MFTLWNRRTFQSLSSKKKIYRIDRKHSILDPKARMSFVLALSTPTEQSIPKYSADETVNQKIEEEDSKTLHLDNKYTQNLNKSFKGGSFLSSDVLKKSGNILHAFGKTLGYATPIVVVFLMAFVKKCIVIFSQLIALTGKLLWRFYRSSSAQEFFGKLGISGVVISMILIGLLNYPSILMRFFPDTYGETVVTALDSAKADHIVQVEESFVLPPKDESLSFENRLIINKIGVDTVILEEPEKTYEEALKKGVWRIPDFANPEVNVKYPTILVAHRFGYLKWSNQFRKQNSFYNLDDLKNGDRFEVIWDQRRYVYQIYAEQEGREITDYSADMILYTCKHLNSPIRIFRYAMRVSESEVASSE